MTAPLAWMLCAILTVALIVCWRTVRIWQRRSWQGESMLTEMRAEIATLQHERHTQAQALTMTLDGDTYTTIVVDPECRVVLAGQNVEHLLGVSSSRVLGSPLIAGIRDHEIDDLVRRSLRETETPAPLMLMRGSRYLSLTARRMGVPGKPPLGAVLTATDISELHHLRTVRRDFVANISHELRTPLATIRLLVETLQNGALDDRLLAEDFLAKMAHETMQLTTMVEHLLALSRIEAGQDSLDLKPTALHVVVATVLDRLDSLANERHITLCNTVSPDLPLVRADSEKLSRVILNLVHNAIMFSPTNRSVYLTAEIRTRTDQSQSNDVVLIVRDEGVGISTSDLPRIFERFYRSDRARVRTSGSTGLGLAIARHIVDAHGGRIWAESEEGQGATFFVALPLPMPTLPEYLNEPDPQRHNVVETTRRR